MVSASFQEPDKDVLSRQREIIKSSKARSEALYKKAEALGFKPAKKSEDEKKKNKDT